MQPVLQSLTLVRFRSFTKEIVRFDNPTFLVGQNGSGKSNLRDALDFLAEAMSTSLTSVMERRGGFGTLRNRISGKKSFGMVVEIRDLMNEQLSQVTYALKIAGKRRNGFEVQHERCVVRNAHGVFSFARKRHRFTSNVEGLRPSLEPVSLGLPIVGGEATFAPVLRILSTLRTYAIEPAKLRELQDPDSGTSLRADGSNCASVLQEIRRIAPDDMTRIAELLATIVPSTTKVQPIKHGKKLTLEFTQDWGQGKPLKFEAFSMSDGTLRALGLLTAVYQRPAPSILVIEEPEATIHPGALGAVLDLLRHACKHMQVIVTTHSPEVLDAEWLRDEHLRIVCWQEGSTTVLPLGKGSRDALREHLMSASELLRSNALRPGAVEADSTTEASLFEGSTS
ncbi:MAG: AAA family ATPase [Gemmataceae bacterium]|nr:AAA family ATPase [Gemmataceae bacterium]